MNTKKVLAKITNDEAIEFTKLWAFEESIKSTLEELIVKRSQVLEAKANLLKQMEQKYSITDPRYHINAREMAIYDGHDYEFK